MRWSRNAYQSNQDTSNYLSFSSLLSLSSPFSFCIPQPQFQIRRFVSCSRIATSPSSFSGSHPPARVTTRATCCSSMPLSVVLHVRDRVSELFSLPLPLSFSPSLFLRLPLSLYLSLFTFCLPPSLAFLRSPLFPAFVLSSSFALVFFPLANER